MKGSYVETFFMELPDAANAQTQTEGLTFRELQGLDKTLQRTPGELVNNSISPNFDSLWLI